MEKDISFNPIYVSFEVWKRLNAAYCIDHLLRVLVFKVQLPSLRSTAMMERFPSTIFPLLFFFLKAHRTKPVFSFLNHHRHNDEDKLTCVGAN